MPVGGAKERAKRWGQEVGGEGGVVWEGGRRWGREGVDGRRAGGRAVVVGRPVEQEVNWEAWAHNNKNISTKAAILEKAVQHIRQRFRQ